MLNDFKNKVDFLIRNKTKFSRKNFIEKNHELIKRNRLENLYTKDILEKSFEKNSKDFIKILDIGSKNWFYVKGEWEFFSDFCENFELHGVEIDAFRLYANLYNRFEVAKYHTRDLKNAKYFAQDLLSINEKYDYIIWFLPFVFIEPHTYWGLPKKLFNPEKLFKHAYEILKDDGQMLIVNQGEDEAKEQKNILEKHKVNYTDLGEIDSRYFKYKNKRFGYLIKKNYN